MKYALIKNNIVELISYQPIEGYIEVNDNVFADMIKKSDGTFDYTEQIEYITENGLEAWQSKVAQIKIDNPKE
jgi:hypothetical protein